MKLDLNCIRDTLITLENWLVLNDDLEFVYLDLDEIHKSSDMLKYSRAEIAYTLVILEEAGFSINDVVKTTVFLADMADFAAMNEIYASQFEGDFPARSAVAVKTLPKNALVEVEVIAVKA